LENVNNNDAIVDDDTQKKKRRKKNGLHLINPNHFAMLFF
jgi:hypothetical protein